MPTTPLADRVSQVADSITLAVTAKAKALKAAGVDVVGFGAGEPDFDTPDFIKNAAKAALDAGMTKYTPSPCVPELKQAIAAKFQRDNGLPYTAEQITTGAGGKFCLYLAMMAILNPGDEVLIPEPYWVSYPEQVKLAGGVPVFIRGEEAGGFRITPAQLESAITDKTKVLILNSPSNPAGHGYDPVQMAALAEVVGRHPNVTVFADEIYEKLIYDGFEAVSFATLGPTLFDRTLTFNCHSKSYAMTGWRVGYVGGPIQVIKAMNKLQSQMTSHITSFTQPAAAEALNNPLGAEKIEAMRQEFERRMHHMHRRLNDLPGVTCVKPQGAFYCFPNVSAHYGKTGPGGEVITGAVGFSAALLEHGHVAVVPGTDSGFDTHVRLSFATSMGQIDKGLDRIGAFLEKLG